MGLFWTYVGLLKAKVLDLGSILCVWLLFHKFRVGGLCQYVSLVTIHVLVLYAM